MQHYKVEAIVMKRINLGEADRLITFLTRKHGKLIAKAPGIRRITSKRAPHLEVFNHIQAVIYQGKSLDMITEAQVINSFPVLRQSLSHVATAFWLLEEVERLCPENHEVDRVFELLLDTFVKLNHEMLSEKALVKLRESISLRILQELGYLSSRSNLQGEALDEFLEEIIQRRMKSNQLFFL